MSTAGFAVCRDIRHYVRVVAPSPSPRRVRTPRWLDLRLVVGVALVLGSVLLGARVVSGADHTYQVLSVSHDLAAGTVLSDSDVQPVRVRLPDHGRGVYLDADTAVAGKQLNRALGRGELLPAAALGSPDPSTTITVPFASGAAPKLRAGERIVVWLSTRACPSTVLLGEVTVQSVADSSGSAFGSGGGQNVVVAVPPALAQRIVTALAFDSPVIRAGVLAGPARPAANENLPDINRCGARTGS